MKNDEPRKILLEIVRERVLQDQKWGVQNHDPFKWLAILGEEVGEVNKAALEAEVSNTHHEPTEYTWRDLGEYRAELIQVAAVAIAMIECLDRGDWEN